MAYTLNSLQNLKGEKNIFSTFTLLLISQHINSQVTGLNWTTEPLEILSEVEVLKKWN